MKKKFENLKIAKRIRTSGLAEIIKKDVLKRLKRIYSSPRETKRCEFRDTKDFGGLMIWSGTKEGYEYWKQINILLENLEE